MNIAAFQTVWDEGWRRTAGTPGHLSGREARFLMLAAAGAPADGAIVEIGSFKGRSTIGLGYVARHYRLGRVVAVDPHTSPSVTDPDLGDRESSSDDFQTNLRRAGVADAIDVRRAFSRDVARGWSGPIRLLWIDGDHVYDAVKQDLELFRPHLAPGSILAMHDVLRAWGGPRRVFMEQVLRSDDFGPAGFCDSIGWAQYRPGDGSRTRFRARRAYLGWIAGRVRPALEAGEVTTRLSRWRQQFWWALSPHRAVDPAWWAAQVALK